MSGIHFNADSMHRIVNESSMIFRASDWSYCQRTDGTQVWDLGGQTSIRPYWRCYYPNTDAIIFVVDSCDSERLGIAKQELMAMLEVTLSQSIQMILSSEPNYICRSFPKIDTSSDWH